MSARRALVTGGAGFVGLHLARALADDGVEVALLDDLSRGGADEELDELVRRDNVSLLRGDVTDEQVWSAAGGGFDEAYHLAAVVGVRHVLAAPERVLRVNALSTIRCVDWLADGGAKRVVFASTSEVYAWTRTLTELPVPTPEDVPLALVALDDPRTSYAASKIYGELAIAHGCRAAGVEFSIVRYHNVYGPRMGVDHVVPELLARLLAGQNPLVVYSPDHRRAFCYVDDAVRATVAAARIPAAAGETINVGSESDVSIGELARLLSGIVRRDVAFDPQPAPHDPVERRAPDLTKARALLGYEPRVSLEDGLALTAAWYAPRLAAAGTS